MKNIVKANVACNFLYKKGTKKKRNTHKSMLSKHILSRISLAYYAMRIKQKKDRTKSIKPLNVNVL